MRFFLGMSKLNKNYISCIYSIYLIRLGLKGTRSYLPCRKILLPYCKTCLKNTIFHSSILTWSKKSLIQHFFKNNFQNNLPTSHVNHNFCYIKILTCNRLSRIGSVLFPDCFAAFTNCFWDAYRFIGHILNRQSRNFFGGFTGSPASGHTTLLSSTRLETK